MYDVITLTAHGIIVRRYEDAECAALWFTNHFLGRIRFLRRVQDETVHGRVRRFVDQYLAARRSWGCKHRRIEVPADFDPAVGFDPAAEWWSECGEADS